jgi:hypothetical protein
MHLAHDFHLIAINGIMPAFNVDAAAEAAQAIVESVYLR